MTAGSKSSVATVKRQEHFEPVKENLKPPNKVAGTNVAVNSGKCSIKLAEERVNMF